ncbi:F-box/kelch-repeat protein At2g44130-like [Punica granatum]|uniref:F-box domain-containing protein n=2 Tax=Punica granatum TaxID=22663 RepID=A0A218WA90_PUNGR|nr:F-box/kelch-repeat protein At2g44130-like [Punica granatum]OWM69270.1 hypothetical protein CDL15_Pgr025457 [Punica granatum]PKI73633.1 hypothetical protein CRG98_006007 [Punica granatum]
MATNHTTMTITASPPMESSEFTELMQGLPEDLGLECLARLSYTSHGATSRVCRRWRHLLRSQEFYYHRQRSGYTRKVACLVQVLPSQISLEGRKSGGGAPIYGITVFDPVGGTWDRLEPAPYPNGLPVFCQLASCEGKLVVMGGWDPVSYDPVTDVFVYDFTTRRWEQRTPMLSKRSFFAAAGSSCEGRVYVAGGHDEGKNALSSAWAYDVRGDTWTELAQMSQARDECEGVVIGREFWVVSGYRTESQGGFEGSAESHGFDSGEWRRVDGAWRQSQCPRSCVGVGKDGKLMSWAESEPAVRVATCGVMLGPWALVGGAQYQGGPHEFYMARRGEGQDGKYEKISVPDEFSGFVQSGCCVEI